MIVEFDKFGQFEELEIVLCQPSSHYDAEHGTLTHVIGNLDCTSDREFVGNWNQISELNLRVWDFKYEDPEKDEQAHSIFQKVELMRLLFVHNLGYFQIHNIDTGWDEYGRHYKELQCESIECELNNRNIPYMPNSTQKMRAIFEGGTWTNPTDNYAEEPYDGLYSRMGDWKLTYIDEKVLDMSRTFEDVDVNKSVYQFMIEDLQDAFECYFIFDIMKREIQVYEKEKYKPKTNIHLSRNDIIDEMNITRDSEDVYTCINVVSEDGTTMISAINPTVDNRLYKFDYFFDWMTPALAAKVAKWEKEVDEAREEYAAFSLDFYEQMTICSEATMECERLEILYKEYALMADNLVAEYYSMDEEARLKDIRASRLISYNRAISKYNGEIIPDGLSFKATCDRARSLANSTLSELETQAAERDKQAAIYDDFLAKQKAYRDKYNIQCYFTPEEFEELSHYIFEGNYEDPYASTLSYMVYRERFDKMNELHERALKHLDEASRPKLEYEISTGSFIFDEKFKCWSDQLELGCFINIETYDGVVEEKSLNNMTVNFDDKTISLTFGDPFNKFDPRSLFVSAMGSIKKTTNSIGVLKGLTNPFKTGEYNKMREALQRSRDLTMDEVLHSFNEEVIIDEFGYTGRRLDGNSYDPRQVKLISKNLVFTDDGWETCKIAIGEIQLGGGESVYGVNAQVLMGDVILGNQLMIKDNQGHDIFKIMDMQLSVNLHDENSEISSYFNMLKDDIRLGIESVQEEVDDQETRLVNYISEANIKDKEIKLQVIRALDGESNLTEDSSDYDVNRAFFSLNFDELESAIRMSAKNITWDSQQSSMDKDGTFTSYKINNKGQRDGRLEIQGSYIRGFSGDLSRMSLITMNSEIANMGTYGLDGGTSPTRDYPKALYLDSQAVCIGANHIGVCTTPMGTSSGGTYTWGVNESSGGFQFIHGICVKTPNSSSSGSSPTTGSSTKVSGKFINSINVENGLVTSVGGMNYGESLKVNGLRFENGLYVGGSIDFPSYSGGSGGNATSFGGVSVNDTKGGTWTFSYYDTKAGRITRNRTCIFTNGLLTSITDNYI